MINVLDHGFVRLVDSMGSDASIIRAARVSTNRDDRTGQDPDADAKRIQSMVQRHHTSPFESVTFTFEVKAPIFVLRQWHRHRTWSYNELSGRYAEMGDDFYVPAPADVGLQSATDKQARVLTGDIDPIQEEFSASIMQATAAAYSVYQHFLRQGIPREMARLILPVNVYSRMYATVDLHNLFGFLTLRADAHAQWEIRQYALALIELIRPIVPVALAAWEKANEASLHLSR